MNSSDQQSPRRPLQQSPETRANHDWANDVPAVSPLVDSFHDMHDWNTYEQYSPMMGSPLAFDSGHGLYTFDDSFIDTNATNDDPQNALGLTVPEIPSSPHTNDTSGYILPQVQPPTPRNTLPQINTALLQPIDSLYHRSPINHSPYGLSGSQPPLSATASTPSSMGNHSMPWTPAPLPNTPHHYFSTTPGGLLSPHPAYNVCYPLSRTPPSPSASLMVTSPSSATSPSSLSSVPTVFELAARFPFAEHIIPQKLYRPNTQSDRRRYVEEVELEQPIMFYSANGETCGIRCTDALSSRFAGLQGRDDPMFEQRGPSVSIRLMWPGYAPWSRQIPTRDFRSPPQPITRAKLAKNVAKTIKRFLEDMEHKPMEDDANPHFKVGRKPCITIDDLEIVGLQHVSMGSWQAHIRLHRRG